VVTSSPSTGASPVSPSSIAVSVDLPHARVRVAGELDRDSAHHLLEAVEILATRADRRWQLDAADVTFCDAAGLRALTGAHAFAAAHGRSLRLVRRSRPVARLVSLLGEDEVFPPAATSRRRGARIRCGTTSTP
jgi:anti-anti-sigma factor